ncbi:hypothetical protein L1049_024448 [Liquidambar formosana]|uniref:Alkyl transferase n=1 Tax=Liquidambar formosana TaxID=63359 RepID=A0AAP0RUG9_LIQFO
MEEDTVANAIQLFGNVSSFIRKFIFRILSVGPIPNHIAFIMDGNRRYAKKWNLDLRVGYKAGILALICMLKYCMELGLKYITIYAFSIDNFKRRPEEIQNVMDTMRDIIEGMLKEESSIVNQHGVRVYFIGNLRLLSEALRAAAEKAMNVTAKNDKAVLLVCLAYTSSNEITHAVQESCNDANRACHGGEKSEIKEEEEEEQYPIIKLVDVERQMYMAVAPDPDILIRSSGETRLSNFLLWQTTSCLLYFPKALWPELGLRHLVWAVLNFQRRHSYLEKKKKQS